jgi:hypothetical protein
MATAGATQQHVRGRPSDPGFLLRLRGHPRRVLVVEDDDDAAALMQLLLASDDRVETVGASPARAGSAHVGGRCAARRDPDGLAHARHGRHGRHPPVARAGLDGPNRRRDGHAGSGRDQARAGGGGRCVHNEAGRGGRSRRRDPWERKRTASSAAMTSPGSSVLGRARRARRRTVQERVRLMRSRFLASRWPQRAGDSPQITCKSQGIGSSRRSGHFRHYAQRPGGGLRGAVSEILTALPRDHRKGVAPARSAYRAHVVMGVKPRMRGLMEDGG